MLTVKVYKKTREIKYLYNDAIIIGDAFRIKTLIDIKNLNIEIFSKGFKG